MPTRRIHATEGDDGLALELNALRVDVADLRAKLLTTGTQLDADTGVTDTDYNAVLAAALTAVTSAELARPPSTNGTEVGGNLDLDGKRVYHEHHDGAVMTEQRAHRADLEVARAALATLTAKLDADVLVNDTNYAALHDVAAATLAAVDVVSGEQLAGEPAQLNSAGARVHSSDGDDSMITEVENLTADFALVSAGILGVLTKLDADTGVTDTDYVANNAPAAQTSFGTRRASAGRVVGLPGGTGPTVVPKAPTGSPL